ncbi:MAG: spore cortex biosynthesis protein YabQ [Clostridiales bacterium]|jgi:spore cortex biosynthesis protein YabQ|nr:spore cortex biosynthesis protein YabQ [Clostridiales bacterium]
MILSMSHQAVVFLLTAAAGFAAGLLFDAFRVFRKSVPHAAFFVALEDVLFWTAFSVVMFYVLLNHNSGEVRPFCVVGGFLGMTLYFETLSRLVLAVGVETAKAVKKALRFIFKVAAAPFVMLYGLLRVPAKLIAGLWAKLSIKLKNFLHKALGCGKIVLTRLAPKPRKREQTAQEASAEDIGKSGNTGRVRVRWY